MGRTLKDPDGAGLSNAQSKEESRLRLLRAGERLILAAGDLYVRREFGFIEGLQLKRICAEAGLSSGPFYAHWPGGIDDYLPDLGAFIVSDQSSAMAGDVQVLADSVDQLAGLEWQTAILRFAHRDLKTLVSNVAWAANVALILRYVDRPGSPSSPGAFADAAATGYRRFDDEVGDLYVELLGRCGRRLRKPWTAASVGAVLQAFVEGAALREMVESRAEAPATWPTMIGDVGMLAEDEEASGLYGHGVLAFLATVTQSIRTTAS